MRRWALLVTMLVVVDALADGAPSLPGYVSLPPEVQVDFVEVDDFAEAEMPVKEGELSTVKGRRWHAGLVLRGAPEDLAMKAVWARLRPSMLGAGWSVAREFDQTPFSVTLHTTKGGRNAWARLEIGSPSEIQLHVVDAKATFRQLTLAPPAAKVERVEPSKGDFPYLKPPAGAQLLGAELLVEPFLVNLQADKDPDVVSGAALVRRYHVEGLSNLEFVEVYRAALLRAGWQVLAAEQAMHRSDSLIVAHYTRSGRDVWAQLSSGAGDLTFSVADVGAKDLAAALRDRCRVTLDGVLFDFDRSTLRGGSEATLLRVRDALLAAAPAVFTVEGHTDNVGTEQHNQQLSEARAQSVLAWLIAKGIPQPRLRAVGFGMKAPVAPNDTPVGRARNRRVELACTKEPSGAR